MASGDGFNEWIEVVLSSIPQKVRCVNDTCTWADNVKEAFIQTCEVLDKCANNGIIMNPFKFQFCQDYVDFAVLEITNTRIRPCKNFMDAIKNYPVPTNISGVRGWYGLVNQAAYAFWISKEMDPFRHY